MQAREYANAAEMLETYRRARARLHGRNALALAGPEERKTTRPDTLARLPVIVGPCRVRVRRPQTPPWLVIVKEVAEKHGVPVADVLRPTRRPQVSAARLECYYRIRTECHYSFPEIAHRMDCQDSSNIQVGYRAYAKKLAEGEAA